ncbi:hypothetical protein ACHAXT_001771 [Thalassiosira profunda]
MNRCGVSAVNPGNVIEIVVLAEERNHHFEYKSNQSSFELCDRPPAVAPETYTVHDQEGDTLHANRLVAVLACDSAGRIGFVVPSPSDYGDSGSAAEIKEEYAASLYYAPMKEFVPWAKANHIANLQKQQNGQQSEEPETWTPQYTPPPEEECGPRGWDAVNGGNGVAEEPETWTPQYTPPPDEECGPHGWDDQHGSGKERAAAEDDGTAGLFVPPGASDDVETSQLWGWSNEEETSKPENDGGGWDAPENFGKGWGKADSPTNNATGIGGWTAAPPSDGNQMNAAETFHADEGAAAADAFYSGLTRTLATRADSRLYHMRAFNGWVKATQIAELDPNTASSSKGKKRSRMSPLRVLDLACGKGGDLGKWTLHRRKLENYVGVDVARGSLVDAALRARDMSKRNNVLRKCTFTLADLGEDVPGRRWSKRAKRMQKLLTWNLQSEPPEASKRDPVFVAAEGGGIAETDKFDVVSIQFAIHYMMSTRKRARRFFHTVSSLLEVGGNLIVTTIDSRVVVEKLMELGLDFHFDDVDRHPDVDSMPGDVDEESNQKDSNRRRNIKDEEGATVMVGDGVCRLKFEADTLRRIFQPKTSDDMFGLQYTFTLVEGSDHAAGVGEAVDLPEWLTPVPALKELAEESGLQLEYATNFHTFFDERKSPAKNPAAHNALYNMKVLNRGGSISSQEWGVSRMYIALKFRKVGESKIELGDEDVGEDETRD